MNDTPRTDSKRGFYDLDTAVDAEFAEQLERELNAATEQLWLQDGELSDLKRKNEQLKERIKRLEVAGDIMEWGCIDPESVRDWRKAKEAKP